MCLLPGMKPASRSSSSRTSITSTSLAPRSALELVELDRLERLELLRLVEVALELEEADRAQPPGRRGRPRRATPACRTTGSSRRSTKPAFVPKRRRRPARSDAPGTWPAAKASAVRTSSTVAPSGDRRRARAPRSRRGTGRGSARRCAPCSAAAASPRPPPRRRTRRPSRARARRFRGARRRSSRTARRSCRRRTASRRHGRGRRWTSSGSSSSRCRLWKSPSAPSRASTARSGRATAPTNSESPVKQRAVGEEAAVLGPVAGRVDRPRRDRADARSRRRPRAGRAGTRRSASAWIETGTPCSSASRPWPETWSACVCVSSTRTMRTPRRRPPSRYGSIAKAGSTSTASPASSSPTRYEAQPRSSSTNCRKSIPR